VPKFCVRVLILGLVVALSGCAVLERNNEPDVAADTFADLSPIVAEAIPLGEAPAHVAVGHGAIWVANESTPTVSRIDPESREVTALIELDHYPAKWHSWILEEAEANAFGCRSC
jgi:hypothetical protein